jgi:hypothetical protein
LTKENISQVLQDFEIGYESNHTFETYYGEELKTLGLSDEELVVLYTENSDKLNPDFVVSILEDVGSKSMFLKTQYTPLELFKKQVLKKQNRTKTPLQIDLELINKVLLEQGVHKTLVENIETFTKPENKPLLIELIKQNPDMIDFVDVSAISAISLKELNKLDNVIYDIMDSRTKSGQEKSDLLYRMSDSLNPQKLFNILEAKLQTQTVFFDEDENQEREINELEKDFKTYRGNNSRVYGERLVSGMKRSELLKNQKMIDLINKLWYVYDNSGIGYHRGNLLNLASDGVLKEIVNKPHQFSFYSIGNGENFVNDKIKPILENKNVSKETLTDLVSAIKVASKQFAPVDRGVASSYAPKIDKMIKNQIHKMDEIMANNKRP